MECVMPTKIVPDVYPFDVEMRKAAAECGWDEHSENVVLMRFIASSARFHPPLLNEFKEFLANAAQEEDVTDVAAAATHQQAVAEEEVEEDETDSDLDDEDEDEEDEDSEIDDEDDLDDDLCEEGDLDDDDDDDDDDDSEVDDEEDDDDEE